MNRTDRLLALVLELQRRRWTRAEDLAAAFEISKRTVYRDVRALCEAGVPVIAEPGRGYSLADGYFLPPVRLSTNEATMLLLGSDFAARSFDAEFAAAARAAGRKIEAVLPEAVRDEVRYLQTSICFIAYESHPEQTAKLGLLRRALIERRRVRFRYHTRFASKPGVARRTREADPYGLAHAGDAWFLIAYCHLRREPRTFRLDRISELTLLNERFERPTDFNLEPQEAAEDRPLVVRVRVDAEVAPWVRESRSYYITEMREEGGNVVVTLRARHEQELMPWLLSWGSHLRVLEPASLRRRVAEEARRLFENNSSDC